MLLPKFDVFGIEEMLTLTGGLGFLLLVVNYLLNILPLSRLKSGHATSNMHLPVSVIICARNEDDNLTEFLPKVLSQDYPEFEVIVVNDCSFDNTETVIDEFAKIFPNLRKVNIKEDAYYKHGKKIALLMGIKGAKYEHLLLTDADCYPASDQWLKSMTSGFSEKHEIVLGYGAYEKQPGLLNRLIRFDAFMIAVGYLSAAIRKKPFMGVGRNLAYTQKLFYRKKGFSSHYHINSGDDDLFVNEAADHENTTVCANPEAVTYSKAKKDFRSWALQKSRHLTTAPLYSGASKMSIGFNYFTQYFFYLSLIGLCLSINTLIIAPAVLTLKVTLQWILLSKAGKKLNEKDLIWGSVIWEPLLLLLYPVFHVYKLFYKPNKWTN